MYKPLPKILTIKNSPIEGLLIFANEYKKMLSSIEYLDYRLDLNNRVFMFERVEKPNYNYYRKWKSLSEKILKIRDL